MKVKAENVAKFFYQKNNRFTDKQIQKLTYYAYAWYLTKNNKKLFDESPEAGIHGPIFMELNKMLQKGELTSVSTECIDENNEIKSFLEIIYRIYGNFSGTKLEGLANSGKPWRNARVGLSPTDKSRKVIKDEDIIAYFAN